MPDKMMRMAGRGEDGLAKAIKTDDSGYLVTQPQEIVQHMDEEGSYLGRDISAGATWQSDVFDSQGLNRLMIRTAPSSNVRYAIKIVELVRGRGGVTFVEYKTHNVTTDSGLARFFETTLSGFTKHFRMEVTNKGSESFRIGFILYGSRLTYENQAIEQTLQELNNKTTTLVDSINSHTLQHMDEETSNAGRNILAGQTWSSEVFDNLGNQKVTIRTAPNDNQRYSIQLVELLKGKGESVIEYQSHNVTSDHRFPHIFEVDLSGKTNLFRVEVSNKETTTLKMGLIVQSSNSLKENLASENTLQNIHDLTSEINDVSKDRFIQYMDENGSYAGRDIEGGSEWESEVFNLNNNQKITLQTFKSSGAPYRIEIDELVYGWNKATFLTTNTRKTDVFTSNQTIELMVQSSANMFRIRVINESEETFKIGLVVTSSPVNVISYYDGTKFKNQEEIATEKTLEKLLEAIRNSGTTKKPKPKPVLKNVKMIDPDNVLANIVLGFHDGLFYGRNILKDNKLFTSEDGEVWTEFKTFNFSVNTNIEKFLASDTGRLIVGGENGEVFISDEDGAFGSSPSFTTGRLKRHFGKFKHENLLGFLCYDVHGFDSGQKHEAWLSIDNGETFTKIFDNNTLQGLLSKYPDFNDSRAHLHDIEYDPYSGRLYIWQGDFDTRTFYYSDDWGKTWEMGIPRGVVGNSTQIIAVPDGLVFGADTNGGGVAFLPLDRSKNIQPIIDVNDYDNDHWKLNRDGERFVAVDKWVDRENSIYMLAYTVEFDDYQDRSGYLAYSRDGVDWDILMKSPHRGNFTGFETIAYGNGKLVCTYNFSKQYVLTADVTFDEV